MQVGLILVDNVCISDIEGVCALRMMGVRGDTEIDNLPEQGQYWQTWKGTS